MTTAVVITVLVLVLAAIAAVALAHRTRNNRAGLRHRFGPEYDRALEQYGSPARAEQELAARAKRVQKFRLRDLDDADRQHFSTAWRSVQARFVDDPSGAVAEADVLITAVMQARGYPMEDFDQRVADLSVDHAEVVQHYRAARALAEQNRAGQADTEELRQAFVHYRALFADLLQVNPAVPHGNFQEARA